MTSILETYTYLPNQHTEIVARRYSITDSRDTAQTLELTQLITSPTRIDEHVHNLRDLIFTNNPASVSDSGTLSPFLNLDHFPAYVTFQLKNEASNKPQFKELLDFQNTNIDRLTNILIQTNWDVILNNDVDEAVKQFTQTLLDAANKSIPTKRIRTRRNDKPWVTSELKREIRKRDRLFNPRPTGVFL